MRAADNSFSGIGKGTTRIYGMLLSAESACISKCVSPEVIIVSVKPECVNGTFHFPVTSHIPICLYKWLILCCLASTILIISSCYANRHASWIFVLVIASNLLNQKLAKLETIYEFLFHSVCVSQCVVPGTPCGVTHHLGLTVSLTVSKLCQTLMFLPQDESG